MPEAAWTGRPSEGRVSLYLRDQEREQEARGRGKGDGRATRTTSISVLPDHAEQVGLTASEKAYPHALREPVAALAAEPQAGSCSVRGG